MIDQLYILETQSEDLPRLIGPFKSRAEADGYAKLNIPNGSWTVSPLTYPYLRRGND